MSQFEEQEISEGKDYAFKVFIGLEAGKLLVDLEYNTSLTADNQEQAREKFLEEFNSLSLEQVIEAAPGIKDKLFQIDSGIDFSQADIVKFEAKSQGDDNSEIIIEYAEIG